MSSIRKSDNSDWLSEDREILMQLQSNDMINRIASQRKVNSVLKYD